jgi:integrase
MNALNCLDPLIRVMDYVPTEQDFDKILVKCFTEGIRLDVIVLKIAVRYAGLRIKEILNLKVTDCILVPAEGLPYVWVNVLKQGRVVRVALPLHAKAAAALKEQIGNLTGGPVWPWQNPPYKLSMVKHGRGKLVSIGKLAGVPIRPYHDWRKRVKLVVKRKLKDNKLAKAFQGHRTDSADDYYTFFQREDLEAAVADSHTVTKGVTKKE